MAAAISQGMRAPMACRLPSRRPLAVAASMATHRMHGAASAVALCGRALPQQQQQSQQRAASAVQQQQRRGRRGAAVAVQARYGGGGYRATTPGVGDRVLAALPFLLPFLDAFSYGRFLFFQFPLIARAVAPMAPLLSLYHSIPFAALICFFGIYLGVVNNQSLPRFVRFSGMQAVLLDILLVLPRLIEQLVSPPTTAGLALQAYITAQNTIWVGVAAAVAYGVASALLGREARIPFIADAAEAQLR